MIKRLLPLIVIALLAPSLAEAKDRGREGKGWRAEARAEQRMERRAARYAQRERAGPPPWAGRPDKAQGRGKGRGQRRGQGRDQVDRDDRRIQEAAARRYGRGATLPQNLRGPRVEDYGRYRLRRPPPGYSYYRRGNRVVLVSDATGMIFDEIPIGR